MSQMQSMLWAVKFKNEFESFLSYLIKTFPSHGGFRELKDSFESASIIAPGKFRTLFDEYICTPYCDRIMKCDATVIDDLHADGHDFLDVYDLWHSPEFDETKKATCIGHMIKCCTCILNGKMV